MPVEVDVAIIGAGVVGLAIAAELAQDRKNTFVFEKNRTFGLETSSRNSEVIHAGIYYPEGSLKAKTCVSGNALLYELSEKHGIAHKRLGKLIVAVSDKETEQLETLLERGKRNGVKDLKLLSKRELKECEPNVEGVAAILSPSTGIIDAHALMRHFLSRARDGSVQIAYHRL